MVGFLAIIGALFLLYLAIRSFPVVLTIIAGLGVLLIVIFVIMGITIIFLPVLLLLGLVLLIARLLAR
ncbi:hypothetical protein [Kosmotoga pacifica]|uniref:Uncharacterized protein n=1 Tax=Kosmotoga pacifica TaxID=1330330 RepID=A0A0G2Z6M7_9BACT|nr:hypothetical protein [Kosmotoga pacifica]AKI97260.1 hypothetical protein IX53_04895 [Kosmotoga pacifica]